MLFLSKEGKQVIKLEGSHTFSIIHYECLHAVFNVVIKIHLVCLLLWLSWRSNHILWSILCKKSNYTSSLPQHSETNEFHPFLFSSLSTSGTSLYYFHLSRPMKHARSWHRVRSLVFWLRVSELLRFLWYLAYMLLPLPADPGFPTRRLESLMGVGVLMKAPMQISVGYLLLIYDN